MVSESNPATKKRRPAVLATACPSSVSEVLCTFDHSSSPLSAVEAPHEQIARVHPVAAGATTSPPAPTPPRGHSRRRCSGRRRSWSTARRPTENSRCRSRRRRSGCRRRTARRPRARRCRTRCPTDRAPPEDRGPGANVVELPPSSLDARAGRAGSTAGCRRPRASRRACAREPVARPLAVAVTRAAAVVGKAAEAARLAAAARALRVAVCTRTSRRPRSAGAIAPASAATHAARSHPPRRRPPHRPTEFDALAAVLTSA